jgi:ABC-type phosphate transport system substrate-binding protein
MKTFRLFNVAVVLTAISLGSHGQGNVVSDVPMETIEKFDGAALSGGAPVKIKQKVTVITGARFSYPLVQRWIDRYNVVNPNVQIIIEARGSADPTHYDILAEVYSQDEETRANREYLNVARYAILPVANIKSAFARTYADKGLNKELINQVFFHDLYADQEDIKKIKVPYTVYTRLQKAGVPIVFTKYFGFEQKDIKGKAIAGADEHLLKALLRDSTGLTYLPLALIYDHATQKPLDGLTVLPVDINGNGRISGDEKFYGDLGQVIERLEQEEISNIHNIPTEYLHLSIDRSKTTPEAVHFLQWVIENGQADLHQFGYLKPEAEVFEREKVAFASKDKNK